MNVSSKPSGYTDRLIYVCVCVRAYIQINGQADRQTDRQNGCTENQRCDIHEDKRHTDI